MKLTLKVEQGPLILMILLKFAYSNYKGSKQCGKVSQSFSRVDERVTSNKIR